MKALPTKRLVAALLLASPAARAAGAAPPPPAARQRRRAAKLIVAISVDQFSADLFQQYRNRFTGGFARLLNGVVFPSGYQSHAATETCPGHSTILTGIAPRIPASSPTTGSTSARAGPTSCLLRGGRTRPRLDPRQLYRVRHPPEGADLGRADEGRGPAQPRRLGRGQGSRGGHDGRPQGRRTLVVGRQDLSSAMPAAPCPRSSQRANARGRRAGRPAAGGRCRSPTFARRSTARSRVGAQTLGTGGSSAQAGDARLPRLARRRRRGARDRGRADPGHEAGPRRRDRHDRDRAVRDRLYRPRLRHAGHRDVHPDGAARSGAGRFFDVLDRLGRRLRGDADRRSRRARHDRAPAVERAMPMETHVDPPAADEARRRRDRPGPGLAGPVLLGAGGRRLCRPRAAAATAHARARRGGAPLQGACRRSPPRCTAAQIAATPMPTSPPETWTLIERARASYDPERSGDLLVLLKPRVTTIEKPGARLCRDARQPVGLRPPRADPLLAQGA